MSKITLVNNGEEKFSFQNHMAGRCEIPAGETLVINLDPAKDITSQAFLKKFYDQYKDYVTITYDIADYPLDFAQVDVTFNTDGGSAVAKQTIYEGEKATQPEDPTKDEATFGGWYADEGKTVEFDFNEAIFEDTTVYAKWSTAGKSASAGAGGVDAAEEKTAKVAAKKSSK